MSWKSDESENEVFHSLLELKLNLVESRTFFDFVIIKQAQVPLAEFHLKMEDGTIYFYYINCDWNCNYITDEICKFHEFDIDEFTRATVL